jgi:hypothetical protein
MTNVSGLRQKENPSSTTGVADLTESEIDAVAGGTGLSSLGLNHGAG